MDDVGAFAEVLLVVCAGLLLAIGVRVVAGRLAIPSAGLLLVAAAVPSDVVDGLADVLTFEDVQRVATLALIVILFQGRSSSPRSPSSPEPTTRSRSAGSCSSSSCSPWSSRARSCPPSEAVWACR